MSEPSFVCPALKPTAESVKPTPAMAPSGIPTEQQPELAGRIAKASMEWVSQVGQMQRYEADFAVELARCKQPSEAVALRSRWLARRVDSAVSMQHRLLELWPDSVTAAAHARVSTAAWHEADEDGERPSAH